MRWPSEADVAELFRTALRTVASTVSIVTATDGGRHHGMTMTSVMSVSMRPASLAICINRSTLLHDILTNGSAFCVNFLREDQSDLSMLFSAPATLGERFATGDWGADPRGPRRLRNAQASVLCLKSNQVDHGTHTLFIGDVIDVATDSTPGPLLYHNASYCRSQPGRAEAA